MRVTVCELNDEPNDLARDWEALAAHCRAARSELVLLPEMCFAPWFARTKEVDSSVWEAAVAAHDAWLPRLGELAPAAVLGSRPVNAGDARLNEAFVWEAPRPVDETGGRGYRAAHSKYYLPDEDGFWEASWYARGDGVFAPIRCGDARVGFQICTEVWFSGRSRAYGQQGVHIIATPRATEKATVDKWLVAGRAAAIMAGAYSLSSNKVNPPGLSADVGGQGWIVDPDGTVLGLTSRETPFVTVDVDLEAAERAKKTYPRYVKD
ncbi:MAG: carbon-nitrogen hydrolase family protein [Anaerolineales bacterium]